MLDIPDNFDDHSKICICESLESMKHLYECKKMNENEAEISFEKIYNGNVNEQLKVSKRMNIVLEKRGKM